MERNTTKKMTAKTTAYQKNRNQQQAYKQAIAASQITTIYEDHPYPTITSTADAPRDPDTRKNKRRKCRPTKQNRRLVGPRITPRPQKTTKNSQKMFVAIQSIGIAPTPATTSKNDAHQKPRTRPKNRKTTKNSYKAFVAFQSIGIATTQKIPPWNRTNEFVGAPTAAAAKVQKPTLIPVKAKLETDERYNVPPPPHPYYTLICEHSRAKLQKKHHDHLVHDAYSKKKQKRERRILMSLDGHLEKYLPMTLFLGTN